eukprot:Gb_24760 [translate_table: standard]
MHHCIGLDYPYLSFIHTFCETGLATIFFLDLEFSEDVSSSIIHRQVTHFILEFRFQIPSVLSAEVANLMPRMAVGDTKAPLWGIGNLSCLSSIVDSLANPMIVGLVILFPLVLSKSQPGWDIWFAREEGCMSEEVLRRAFYATEEGFLALVTRLWHTKPQIAAVGSCCLVGVIWGERLYIANVGDSRAVMGSLTRSNGQITAIQLTADHNASLEEVRQELKALHPDDSHIVVVRRGVWRVKGIIQLLRSIRYLIGSSEGMALDQNSKTIFSRDHDKAHTALQSKTSMIKELHNSKSSSFKKLHSIQIDDNERSEIHELGGNVKGNPKFFQIHMARKRTQAWERRIGSKHICPKPLEDQPNFIESKRGRGLHRGKGLRVRDIRKHLPCLGNCIECWIGCGTLSMINGYKHLGLATLDQLCYRNYRTSWVKMRQMPHFVQGHDSPVYLKFKGSKSKDIYGDCKLRSGH